MSPRWARVLDIFAVALAMGAVFVFVRSNFFDSPQLTAHVIPIAQTASTNAPSEVNSGVLSTGTSSTSVTEHTVQPTSTAKIPAKNPVVSNSVGTQLLPPPTQPKTNEATRIQNPYSFPAFAPEIVNETVRSTLINIFCIPKGGSLRPISASGVIISPQGLILTNAHVGQYILLSESNDVDLVCTARTGSPATPRYRLELVFIPPVWVDEHYREITSQHALGTGEHDYAILRITGTTDNSPMPPELPYLPVDTREAVGFLTDQVLVAGYPAELVGGLAAQVNLFAASSWTVIKELFTFQTGTVDLISVGGVIEAQGGSSGGAVVNLWGHLVGLIVTTSDASNTRDRDLRSLTLSYIDRDIAAQSGISLSKILAVDPAIAAAQFNTEVAPKLISKYISVLR